MSTDEGELPSVEPRADETPVDHVLVTISMREGQPGIRVKGVGDINQVIGNLNAALELMRAELAIITMQERINKAAQRDAIQKVMATIVKPNGRTS